MTVRFGTQFHIVTPPQSNSAPTLHNNTRKIHGFFSRMVREYNETPVSGITFRLSPEPDAEDGFTLTSNVMLHQSAKRLTELNILRQMVEALCNSPLAGMMLLNQTQALKQLAAEKYCYRDGNTVAKIDLSYHAVYPPGPRPAKTRQKTIVSS